MSCSSSSSNLLTSLHYKLLNCAKDDERFVVQEVHDALVAFKENDEGNFSSDLEFLGMLFIEKLLDCYAHYEMEEYLDPLLAIYKKHLNHHILHEVGDRVLVYLDTQTHDMRKEQLVEFYLKLLQHAELKAIDVETVFPLSEMTLFKVMDYVLVCKNKVLQKSVLKVFYTLLPHPTEDNRNAEFFPNNALMQNAMWKFKTSLFESGVVDFMNYLNSQQDQIFHLNTTLIAIGSRKYGKDESNERTYIDFNCSQRLLVCNILSEVADTPVSIEILESNIAMIFAKEMPRLRAAEIRVEFTVPLLMDPLHSHAVKFIRFRFFTQLIRDMTIYKTDSFLTRFFGGLSDFKGEAQAYAPDLPAHATNVKSVSSLGHHLHSPDKWDLSSISLPPVSDRSRYTYNDDRVLGTSLHRQSLSSNTIDTYSEFVAPCASTPDPCDGWQLSGSLQSSVVRAVLTGDGTSAPSSKSIASPEDGTYLVCKHSDGVVLSSTNGSLTTDDREELQVQSERSVAASFSCATYLKDSVSELSNQIALISPMFSESTQDQPQVRDSQLDTETTYYSMQSPAEIVADVHDPPVRAARQIKSILRSPQQFGAVPPDESQFSSSKVRPSPSSCRPKVLQKKSSEKSMDVSVYTDLNLALSSCDGSQAAAAKDCVFQTPSDKRGCLVVKSAEMFAEKKPLAPPSPRFVTQASGDVLVDFVLNETTQSAQFCDGYFSAWSNQSSVESGYPAAQKLQSGGVHNETYNMKDKLVDVLQNIVIGADVAESDSSFNTVNDTVDMDLDSPEADFVSFENDQTAGQLENVNSSAEKDSSTNTLVNVSQATMLGEFGEDADEHDSFLSSVQYDVLMHMLTEEVEQERDEVSSRGEIISGRVSTLSTNIAVFESAEMEPLHDQNKQQKCDQVDRQIHLSTPKEIETMAVDVAGETMPAVLEEKDDVSIKENRIEKNNGTPSLVSEESSFNKEVPDALEESKEYGGPGNYPVMDDSTSSSSDDGPVKRNRTEKVNSTPLLTPQEVSFDNNADALEEDEENRRPINSPALNNSTSSTSDDMPIKENRSEKKHSTPLLAPEEVSFNKNSGAPEEDKENRSSVNCPALDESTSSISEDVRIKKDRIEKKNFTPSLASENVSFNKNSDAQEEDKDRSLADYPALENSTSSTDDDVPIRQNRSEKKNLTPSLAPGEVLFNETSDALEEEDKENSGPVNYPAPDESISSTSDDIPIEKNRSEKKILTPSLAPKEVSVDKDSSAVDEDKENRCPVNYPALHDTTSSIRDDIPIKKRRSEKNNLTPSLAPQEVLFNKDSEALEANKENSGPVNYPAQDDSTSSTSDDIPTKEGRSEKKNLTPSLAPEEVSFNKNSDALDSTSSVGDDVPTKKNRRKKQGSTALLTPAVSFNKNSDALEKIKENRSPVNSPALDDSTSSVGDDVPMKKNRREKQNPTALLAPEVSFNNNSDALEENKENQSPVNYPAQDDSTSSKSQKRKKHSDRNKNRNKKKMNESLTLRRSSRIQNSTVNQDLNYSEISDESMEIEEEDLPPTIPINKDVTEAVATVHQEEELPDTQDVQNVSQTGDMHNDSFNILVDVATQAEKIEVPPKLTEDENDDESTTSRFFSKKTHANPETPLQSMESVMLPCGQVVSSTPKPPPASRAVRSEENSLEDDNASSISSIVPSVSSIPKAPERVARNADVHSALPSSSGYFDSVMATMFTTNTNRPKSLCEEMFLTPNSERRLHTTSVLRRAPKRKRYNAPPAAGMASFVPTPENNLEERIARRIKYGLEPSEREAVLKSMARIRDYLAHNEVTVERKRPRQCDRQLPPDVVARFLRDLQYHDEDMNK